MKYRKTGIFYLVLLGLLMSPSSPTHSVENDAMPAMLPLCTDQPSDGAAHHLRATCADQHSDRATHHLIAIAVLGLVGVILLLLVALSVRLYRRNKELSAAASQMSQELETVKQTLRRMSNEE